MKILGISALYHDSAASIIIDGEVISAIQEERLSRIKHDSTFPVNAIKACLDIAKLNLSDIDKVIFYEKPLLKFDRILDTYFSSNGKGFLFFKHTMPIWFKNKLFQSSRMSDQLYKIDSNWNGELLFSEHHTSHAASAFYPSPFEKALVLVNDGVGEWETTTIFTGDGHKLEKERVIHYPNSVGLLYSAMTYYLGFKVNEGEYKVMGLAPYGKPRFVDLILNKLCKVNQDGSYALDMKYFAYSNKLEMINTRFEKLFKNKRRHVDQPLNQFHMDMASSIQIAIETIILKLLNVVHSQYKIDNLCLAGGVALNCVLNGKILSQTPFKRVWIQPAAGDAGGSLGAALACYYQTNTNRMVNNTDSMKNAYLGRSFSDDEVENFLNENCISFEKVSNTDDLCSRVAKSIEQGATIGWFQGRSEFGPRALGNRSILADPRSVSKQHEVNMKIKFRESFRPFAPAVMEDKISEWFDISHSSPYMLFTTQVASSRIKSCSDGDEVNFISSDNFKVDREIEPFKSEVAAITHIDKSARIQSVSSQSNPLFYKLISEFNSLTSVPILLNTSFNVNKMPIVDSPFDAYDCFMQTNMDMLVLNNFIVTKNNDSKTS